MKKKQANIGLIYEITNNPYFGSHENLSSDRISEFSKPSEINDITRAIQDCGYKVEVIDGPHDLLKRAGIIKNNCTALFNKSIGFHGLERKIAVPAISQLFGLPLIGSSAYGMTLARHKYHTNRLLCGMEVNVPGAIQVFSEEEMSEDKFESLQFPVIVKPNHESDALGIDEKSVCNTKTEAANRVKYILKLFKQPVVIEEFINGEEWKVAVVGNGSDVKAVGCSGVLKNGKSIKGSLQTRRDVVDDTLSYYTPTQNDLVKASYKIAEMVHVNLGLQDYSRCDFRLNNVDELVCMEISTHPDLSRNSSFCSAAEQSLGGYVDIINALIEGAILRLNSNNTQF